MESLRSPHSSALAINMTKASLKSSDSGNVLSFSSKQKKSVNLNFKSPALEVIRVIYLEDGISSLIGFFQKIVNKWKGWEKTIDWCSLEEELSLSAKSDKLGHATITISVNNYDASETWKTSFKIKIETTQVEKFIKDMKSL